MAPAAEAMSSLMENSLRGESCELQHARGSTFSVASGFWPRVPQPQRLPREGPAPGGGRLRVVERDVFDGGLKQAFEPAEDPLPVGLSDRKKRAQQKGRASTKAGPPGIVTETPRSTNSQGGSAVGKGSGNPTNQRLAPEVRKAQEMYAKWEKTEAVRGRDYKNIVEWVDRSRDLREQRYKRLFSGVRSEGELAYHTAMDLRCREAREEMRKRQLYDEWEEKIFQPMVLQAHKHLNRRKMSKTTINPRERRVSWSLPQEQDQEFKLINRSSEDPVGFPLMESATENAFHEAAEKVLGRCSSAPELSKGSQERGAAFVFRRPLHPTAWAQLPLHDSLYGNWAKKCAYGPGFKRIFRAGPDKHLPDESDGVKSAGTVHSRVHGPGHKGILVGECAVRGEAYSYKMQHGMSCGAPAQDHYNFGSGPDLTDLEFPQGKRAPPPGALR